MIQKVLISNVCNSIFRLKDILPTGHISAHHRCYRINKNYLNYDIAEKYCKIIPDRTPLEIA